MYIKHTHIHYVLYTDMYGINYTSDRQIASICILNSCASCLARKWKHKSTLPKQWFQNIQCFPSVFEFAIKGPP